MTNTLTLPAELGFKQVQVWWQTAQQQIANQTSAAELIVDAAALQIFDSATLALLLAIKKQAKQLNLPLRLVNVPVKLLGLAKIYTIDELLFS